MLSWVENEKSFITSGPGQNPHCWFSHAESHFCPWSFFKRFRLLTIKWAAMWENKQCGFWPGLTQTRLYSYWRWLEAWNFRLKNFPVEVLCYPGSENKGADQLRGNREADLRLCFSHMQNVGFMPGLKLCKPSIDCLEDVESKLFVMFTSVNETCHKKTCFGVSDQVRQK